MQLVSEVRTAYVTMLIYSAVVRDSPGSGSAKEPAAEASAVAVSVLVGKRCPAVGLRDESAAGPRRALSAQVVQ
jgi:hypothetical protein